MDLTSWSRQLADRDLTVVPPSFAVPVQLWLLTGSGHALRFRCRGLTVRLTEFAPRSVTVVPGAAVCGCGCGAIATAPITAGSLAVRQGATPTREAVLDGGRERGWRGYAAGLLTVRDAAPLLDRLLVELDRIPALDPDPIQPVSTGRLGSLTQSDQEPTYSAAGTPASDNASTSWAALTPEPQ